MQEWLNGVRQACDRMLFAATAEVSVVRLGPNERTKSEAGISVAEPTLGSGEKLHTCSRSR